jgi:ribosomal-protein-alanine N-acetyltransferase
MNTARLTLRPLLGTDDHQIFALRTNESVNRYLGRKPGTSIDDARKFIQTILENHSLYWAITLTGTDELIGTSCLFNVSDNCQKAEIGYELLPDFQQQGIMQEAIIQVVDFAFRQLHIHLLEAYTHRDNQASTRLLERLNFEKNGIDEDEMDVFTLQNKFVKAS